MQPHLFHISGGHKIEFRTFDIKNRTNEDYYFTFESLVNFVKDTTNVNKFFIKFVQIVRIENL